MIMDELKRKFIKSDPKKQYVIPPDLVSGMPIFHANHVAVCVTNEEVGLTFCTRMDTMGVGQGSTTALPQATCFISLSQAEALGRLLTEAITEVRKAVEAQSSEIESHAK